MGIAVLGLYAVCILYAAWRAVFPGGGSPGVPGDSGALGGAGERGRGAFFVNNRASSAQGVGFSIIVSCVGASATIGMIGLAFTVGTPAFWWLGSGCVGLLLLSLLLARRVRESGAYTMPQLVEKYMGVRARPLIAMVIVLAWMAILAAQFAALSKVLAALTGFAPGACLAAGFGLIVIHTLGGQAAIMGVDRLQALILLAALPVLLIWLCAINPGWTARTPLELTNSDFPPEKLVYFLFVVGGNYLICPMLFGRFLSARSGGAARRGGLFAVAGLALCAGLIVSIGLAAKGLLPAETGGDNVLAALLGLAPRWLNLIVSIALISAIVSSADSCLVTASTVLAHDLLRRDDIAASRLCVLLLGGCGLALSLLDKGILEYLLMAYDVYACGVVAPVFVALLLGKRRHILPFFACAAVISGGTLGAVSALGGSTAFSYAGMICSALVALLGARRGERAECPPWNGRTEGARLPARFPSRYPGAH